ncbi:MAG TPA: hypothetical protein VI583_13240 [Cyclobacteriaceae bacterium]|nr:hypothetical protein [Cyclobacteriaceae bacterium]
MFRFALLGLLFLIALPPNSYAQGLTIHEQFLSDSLPSSDAEIYLFADDRRLESSPELKFPILSILNQSCGVRNIVLEAGQSEAWLCNQYLASGDSSLLVNTMGYHYTMVKDFWARLYYFNKDLPDSRKLKFTGIDYDRPGPFKTMLSRYFTREILEPEISLIVFEILRFPQAGFSGKSRKSFQNLLLEFNSSLLKNKTEYLKYLSDENYINLVLMTGSPSNNPSGYAQRNRTMYENLTGNEDLVPGKIFAAFTPETIRTSPGTFGYLLDKDAYSPYNDEVFIVDQYYDISSYNGKPLRSSYPREYNKIVKSAGLSSIAGDYLWLSSPQFTTCDYLMIIRNKRDLR